MADEGCRGKAAPQADLLTLLALQETKLLSGHGGRAVQDLSALLCFLSSLTPHVKNM